MGSAEENTKKPEEQSEVAAGSLEDIVATPQRQTTSSRYELLRQRALADNLQQLQCHGLASSLISPKQKRPSTAKQKHPTSVSSPLRRSSRKKSKVEFFQNEDFSRGRARAKATKQNQVHKHFKVRLTVLDESLINKLAAESFVRTQKLATVEAQKFVETASSMCMNNAGERVRESKRQRRTKRKIDKALDLYSMTWMPKGTPCKL